MTDKQARARICWLQKFTGGEGYNVWALDNVEILPTYPEKSVLDKDKMTQFSMNLQCGNAPDKNEYVMSSTDDICLTCISQSLQSRI